MKQLVEEKIKGKCEIEVKRLYIPFVYNKKCKCGANIELDLNNDYLSYPEINTPINENLYCYECNTEYKIDIQLELSIVVRDEDKIIGDL